MPKYIVKNRVAELMAIKRRNDPEVANMTQDDLADHLGISRSSIYNWMRNRSKRWDNEAIVAFMKFFELDSIGELLILDEVEDDESSPETETALATAV